MSCSPVIAGYPVQVTLILRDDGFDELTLDPGRAVMRASRVLQGKYWEPKLVTDMPSLSGHPEEHSIYEGNGFEVSLEKTAYETVNITFRKKSLL